MRKLGSVIQGNNIQRAASIQENRGTHPTTHSIARQSKKCSESSPMWSSQWLSMVGGYGAAPTTSNLEVWQAFCWECLGVHSAQCFRVASRVLKGPPAHPFLCLAGVILEASGDAMMVVFLTWWHHRAILPFELACPATSLPMLNLILSAEGTSTIRVGM